MRDLTDMSSVREQIEEDCVYLLRNKLIKRNELYDYVFHLYMKWNWFSRERINFADICYMEMIVDSIKSKVRTPKREAMRITETFLDYKKHCKHDNK